MTDSLLAVTAPAPPPPIPHAPGVVDLSQMVAPRRERVSNALNLLRRKGAVHHLPYGHLSVSVEILERHAARHRRGGFTAAPPE